MTSMVLDEQVHEAAAWALASYRLERPEDEILPDELTPHDWKRAMVVLEAAAQQMAAMATKEPS